MNKLATIGLSALLAVGTVLPSLTTEAEARRGRGTALAVGAVIGLGAAAALASRPAYGYGYRSGYYGDRYGYRRSSYRRYCDRLAWRCDRGSRSSCWRYEDEC